jgi:HK97 gp10 family phage protein
MSVKVEGLDQLADRLKGLGPDISKKTLARSVSRGARVVRNAVNNRAPIDTGRLKRAVYTKKLSKESNGNQQTYIVGVRSGKRYQKTDRDAFYWRFHEFGTEKLPAKPFIRPAFESSKFEAAERIKEVLIKQVDKYNNYVIG